MAKIYSKTIATGTDKCLILDPREALIYPFDIGDDWTDARLGMFLSITPHDDDNATPTAESISSDTPANNVFLGLKNNDATLPKSTGSLYWGVSAPVALQAFSVSVGAWDYGSCNLFSMAGKDGTFSTGAGASMTQFHMAKQTSASTASYCAYWGQRYTITNRETSTQAVTVTTMTAATKYSTSDLPLLRSVMGSAAASASPASNIAWHDAGVPRAIPNAIFARLPWSLHRLRIHSVLIERYA